MPKRQKNKQTKKEELGNMGNQRKLQISKKNFTKRGRVIKSKDSCLKQSLPDPFMAIVLVILVARRLRCEDRLSREVRVSHNNHETLT